jgi:hypothetical protein
MTAVALLYARIHLAEGGGVTKLEKDQKMLIRRLITASVVQACVFAMATAAWSAEPTKDYLAGTWAIGGAAACGGAATENITFRTDGTFEASRAGKATATGFWHLIENILDLHMVSSPAFFDDPTTTADDALSTFAGKYDYYYAKAMLFDIEDNTFRMVASMNNAMRGANLGRCPKSG